MHRNSGCDESISLSYVALLYDEPYSNDASRYNPAPEHAPGREAGGVRLRGLLGRRVGGRFVGRCGLPGGLDGGVCPPRLPEPNARHSAEAWTK